MAFTPHVQSTQLLTLMHVETARRGVFLFLDSVSGLFFRLVFFMFFQTFVFAKVGD